MPPSPIQKHKSIAIIIGVALCVASLLLYFAPYGLRNYLEIRGELTVVNTELDQIGRAHV